MSLNFFGRVKFSDQAVKMKTQFSCPILFSHKLCPLPGKHEKHNTMTGIMWCKGGYVCCLVISKQYTY